MKNNIDMQKIIDDLLVEHGITVEKWMRGACGRAHFKNRSVRIPKSVDVERFCVSLHEIGHIVKQAVKSRMPLWKSEYVAEMFAIDTAKSHGVDTSKYEKRACGYIAMNLAKGFRRGLVLERVDEAVLRFAGVDKSVWNENKAAGFMPLVRLWASGYTHRVEFPPKLKTIVIDADKFPTHEEMLNNKVAK